MAYFEDCVIALFILWSVASVAFLLRLPRLHRVLSRFNWFEAWVRWSLFNAADPAARPVYFEIEYRDRDVAGNVSPWSVGMTGYSWTWRGFLWNPERRLTDGIHHLGRTIRACVEHGAPAADTLQHQRNLIESHLGRQVPLPAGAEREYRLMKRLHSPGGRAGELVYAFSSTAHAAAR